jgi:hypothetical protein
VLPATCLGSLTTQIIVQFLAAKGYSKTSIVDITGLGETAVAKLSRRRQETIIFGNPETPAQTLASQITA